jgi:2-keto-4-pentenoate hydratase/2-oxohepta-3-ene-1,7-dioic acid hydratase in catechol pathway
MNTKRLGGGLVAGAVLLACVVFQSTPRAQAPTGTFRLATFDANGDARLGATVGNGENDLLDVHNGIRYLLQSGAPEAQSLPYVPADMRTLAGAGPRATAAIRQVYQLLAARKAAGTLKDPGGQYRVFYPASGVKFLAPVTNPSKIYGFAGNYPREGDLANPKFPSSFFKSVASLAGHGDTIDLAGLVTRGVHEPELSLVINRRAKNVSEQEALRHVFGYMICNDVSSRDLQQGSHPTQGATFDKGLDTFSPCGPYLTLAEDVKDPQNLAISATIDGKPAPMPNSNTKFMTFKIPQIIAYISRRMTLEAGDIFQTGVPAPVVPMKAGDRIEITIEGLGTPLRNQVIADGSKERTSR